MILEKILKEKFKRIQERKKIKSTEQIISDAMNCQLNSRSLYDKIINDQKLSVIAEIKKASPSKGIINEKFPYLEIAKEYEFNNAAGISILTEEDFFLGSDAYLTSIHKYSNIPLLRKDFIIDEYQIYESKIIGANVILLICSILNTKKLTEFIKLAEELKLECLVEVHDLSEIEKAMESNAKIIGVNNRNLRTFEVDLNTSVKLFQYIPNGILKISESGIFTREDALMIKESGADAVLVGEALMKSDNIGSKISELMV